MDIGQAKNYFFFTPIVDFRNENQFLAFDKSAYAIRNSTVVEVFLMSESSSRLSIFVDFIKKNTVDRFSVVAIIVISESCFSPTSIKSNSIDETASKIVGEVFAVHGSFPTDLKKS